MTENAIHASGDEDDTGLSGSDILSAGVGDIAANIHAPRQYWGAVKYKLFEGYFNTGYNSRFNEVHWYGRMECLMRCRSNGIKVGAGARVLKR